MSRTTMGYDTTGGFYYKNTSHQLVHVDKTFNIVGSNLSTISASEVQ